MSNRSSDQERNGNRKLLIIGFIIVLLAINGILLYMQHEKKQKIEEQEQLLNSKDKELEEQIAKFESLKTDFERQNKELQTMGVSNDSLRSRIDAVTADLERLRSFRAGSFSLSDQKKYRDRALSLENLLKKKDEEIARLKRDNEQLFSENTNLKTTQNRLSDTLSNQRTRISSLSQKVAMASKLNAEQIRVTMINNKGKEKSDDDLEYRAKSVDKLKITFRLGKNDVAEKGDKDIMIRLIEPDGSTLYNLETGGGQFQHDGQDLFYSAKTTVLFDNTGQSATVLYSKGSEYKKGTHIIELYAEGHKIGEKSFTLK